MGEGTQWPEVESGRMPSPEEPGVAATSLGTPSGGRQVGDQREPETWSFRLLL